VVAATGQEMEDETSSLGSGSESADQRRSWKGSPPQIVKYRRPPENLQSPNRYSMVETLDPVKAFAPLASWKGEREEVGDGVRKEPFRRKYSNKAQREQDTIVVKRTRADTGPWAFLRKTFLKGEELRPTRPARRPSPRKQAFPVPLVQVKDVPLATEPVPPPVLARPVPTLRRSASSAAALSFLRKTFRRPALRPPARPTQRSKSHDFDVRSMASKGRPDTSITPVGSAARQTRGRPVSENGKRPSLPAASREVPPAPPSVAVAVANSGCLPFGASPVGRCLSPLSSFSPLRPSGPVSFCTSVPAPLRTVTRSRDARYEQLAKVHVAQKPKTLAKLSVKIQVGHFPSLN